MQPKTKEPQKQMELFKRELEGLVNPEHALVRLGRHIDWTVFEEKLGAKYHASAGAPGVNTRLMVALHYLKYQFDLSDEVVVGQWVENIHWQHFSGEQFIQYEAPIDPSSMTRWRKRLGEEGAELMLKQTIGTGMKMRVIKPGQIKRVNIDPTVQTKAIRFPTDARLYNRARERLVKAARKRGLKIKQSHERVGPRLLMMSARHAHARQMKRTAACTRKLRTNLGRVIRQIERQKHDPESKLEQLLKVAKKIHAQEKRDKNKIHSMHEPHVQCMAKGKAGKKHVPRSEATTCEPKARPFGNKVSVAVTSEGGWLVGAKSLQGNPYDGHTLEEQLEQTRRLTSGKVKEVHVDMGYRGHNHQGKEIIHVDGRRRGNTGRRLWKRMKHRAAVEPTIGHCKSEHRMERNRLWAEAGDALNAVLSAASMNFGKLLAAFLRFFMRLMLGSNPAPTPLC